MSGTTDAGAIVETALAAAQPFDLGDGRYSLVVPEDGTVKIIDPIDDKHRDAPRRKTGTTLVRDVDGLAYLWAKQALPESELFADPVRFNITAVLNADQTAGELAGFRDHRILLALEQTPAWLAWARLDGRLLSQQEFAEHLEDRLVDVVRPTGAEMLELAQSFEASTSVEFKSAVAISSGQRQLTYEETTAARAGQKGSIEIPTTFDLGLRPFDGSDTYKVTARFRYRIRDGRLQIGYKLERPEDVLRSAFDDVRDSASQACDRPVLLGSPPDPR